MSLATSVPGPTVTRQGGMLLNLPRELRDMIYRHVVKRTYLVCAQPFQPNAGSGDLSISPNLSILRVSKTISVEAMAVLYAESTFRIYVHFETRQTFRLPSIPAVDRMMNIELDVEVRDERRYENRDCRFSSCTECLDPLQHIWKATLGCISRTNNLRNSLHISWWRGFSKPVDFGPGWSNMDAIIPDSTMEPDWSSISDYSIIPYWMYPRLKSMTRFRTVVLQNFTQIDTSHLE